MLIGSFLSSIRVHWHKLSTFNQWKILLTVVSKPIRKQEKLLTMLASIWIKFMFSQLFTVSSTHFNHGYWQCYNTNIKFYHQWGDRCIKNWHQFVKFILLNLTCASHFLCLVSQIAHLASFFLTINYALTAFFGLWGKKNNINSLQFSSVSIIAAGMSLVFWMLISSAWSISELGNWRH